jgi:hypothetical protein
MTTLNFELNEFIDPFWNILGHESLWRVWTQTFLRFKLTTKANAIRVPFCSSDQQEIQKVQVHSSYAKRWWIFYRISHDIIMLGAEILHMEIWKTHS